MFAISGVGNIQKKGQICTIYDLSERVVVVKILKNIYYISTGIELATSGLTHIRYRK